MTDWVRLWHDMPTDPKWRVIARKSGQRIGDVIAVFGFMLVNASANASERGRTHNLFAEDIGAALDMDEADVSSILNAMKGKVVSADGKLLGWEKRQPKREDSSAERAKAWREAKKAERNRTQPNATERPETETEIVITEAKASAASGESDKKFWDSAKAYLGPKRASLIGQWIKIHGKDQTASAITAAQLERAVNPVEFIQGRFRKAKTYDRDRITV